jgi:hypothetical protein
MKSKVPLKAVSYLRCSGLGQVDGDTWDRQTAAITKYAKHRIRLSAFHSITALEQAIRNYLDEHKKKPKPLAWTATADTILERIANVFKRTSSSGH